MDYEDQGIEWDAIETIASMAVTECENSERPRPVLKGNFDG